MNIQPNHLVMAEAAVPQIRYRLGQSLLIKILCLILLTASGCSVMGPKSISMGRADYNEAINRTEDEQMLLSIVKGRYGDTFSLLAVSGIAANVRFRANANIQAGFGPDTNFLGNLVPFSGGVAIEENPTITYAPVKGRQYLRQLMSPIPLDILVLFVRSGTSLRASLPMIANRINDLQNPDFVKADTAEPDDRFQRFSELNFDLIQAGVVEWVADPREDIAFDILITEYAPVHSKKVGEYLSLLGLAEPEDPSADIVLPVYLGIKGRDADGIAISTRSTFDLIEIFRAAIEIPKEHAEAGIAIAYPAVAQVGKKICIHSSKDRPNRAALAVKHRGHWFYIDDTDVYTKLSYEMIRSLWSVSIAASANQSMAPVLTVPVSR